MTISIQQLVLLSPLIVIGLTIVMIVLSISYRRNHLFVFLFSIFGLSTALLSLCFIDSTDKADLTPLIHFDNYSTFCICLSLLASIAICIFAYPWLESFKGNKEEFYLLILIAVNGSIILAESIHLATFFIGTELISIPSFGLISYIYRKQHSLKASIKYAILSSVFSSFLLFGIALLYVQFGSLSFVDFGKMIDNNTEIIRNPLFLTGLGMIFVSVCFKLSLVPFHLWTPDVYQGASVLASAFLSTVSKISIFSAMVRLFLYTPISNSKAVCIVLGIIAFFSIVCGNLMALNQTNIRRLLGYSSISHLSYLLIALIALQDIHIHMFIETVGIYLSSYLLSSLGIFGIISLISNSYPNSDSIFSYRGLFWNNPILALIMTIKILALAGIPMTIGFISKFYILIVSMQSHLWLLTVSIMFGSFISLYYYLRMITILYMSPPEYSNRDTLHNWQYSSNGIILIIFTLMILILGIYPQLIINVLQYTMPIVYNL